MHTGTPFYFPNREALVEKVMAGMGKIHMGRPVHVKTRKELLATVKPSMRQYLRPDTGDMPESHVTPPSGFIPVMAT